MKLINYFLLITLFITGCEVSGLKKTKSNTEDKLLDSMTNEVESPKNNKDTINIASNSENESKTISYDNGIKITWLKKGNGESIKSGDLVNIDYRNSLEDGTIYDGNHLVKKSYIPFLVGWNQQTEGWDFAIKQLSVGDEVEVFIPAELARGERGIPGVVPPNANNILSLRIKGINKPTFIVDDIRIWIVERSKKPGDTITFGDEIKIHYWANSESTPRYDNSYQRGEPFSLVMGDGNIVPGLYKALHFGKKGDKMMIHIPAKEAYGNKGFSNLVLPNEDLFYDIMIVDVVHHDEL